MGAHAKQRRHLTIVPHAPSGRRAVEQLVRRVPGASPDGQLPDEYRCPDLVAAAREATPDAALVRLLEGLRQWEATAGTAPDSVAPVTLDAIRTTAECALDLYRKGDPDGEFPTMLGAVNGYVSALLAYAEGHLDTGRVVVRETLRRARAVQDGAEQPGQEVAAMVRDLVCLLGAGSGPAETP